MSDYDKYPATADKVLQPDGSIVSILNAETIAPADADRAQLYSQYPLQAAKYLLPDGSIINGVPIATIISGTATENDLVGVDSEGGLVYLTAAEVKTILGLSGTLPEPSAENDFIAAAGSPVGWGKKTLAEVKTILGLVLTFVSNSIGFSISGGTISKTLTVDEDITASTVNNHIGNTSNPHTVTKTQVGLANVTNDTQLKAASNLSDVASAATARTNLGVVTLAETKADTDIADAISKKHTQGSDTTLGAMAADINANSHQVTSLSIPDAAGEAIRQTAKITESNLEDAVDKKHTQNTDTGTTATTFKINSGGNEADIQTTGLTADRDYTLPDVDTMLAGSVITAQNNWEIITY